MHDDPLAWKQNERAKHCRGELAATFGQVMTQCIKLRAGPGQPKRMHLDASKDNSRERALLGQQQIASYQACNKTVAVHSFTIVLPRGPHLLYRGQEPAVVGKGKKSCEAQKGRGLANRRCLQGSMQAGMHHLQGALSSFQGGLTSNGYCMSRMQTAQMVLKTNGQHKPEDSTRS